MKVWLPTGPFDERRTRFWSPDSRTTTSMGAPSALNEDGGVCDGHTVYHPRWIQRESRTDARL